MDGDLTAMIAEDFCQEPDAFSETEVTTLRAKDISSNHKMMGNFSTNVEYPIPHRPEVPAFTWLNNFERLYVSGEYTERQALSALQQHLTLVPIGRSFWIDTFGSVSRPAQCGYTDLRNAFIDFFTPYSYPSALLEAWEHVAQQPSEDIITYGAFVREIRRQLFRTGRLTSEREAKMIFAKGLEDKAIPRQLALTETSPTLHGYIVA